ncbi:ATP-binding protein [Streptosporangium carneum]|uniref:NB-ARC domain-containing protein n=1 Tax=Streptosporangium carneum TaxID=47481 RepID=A0A9W6I003_9ACTN|nr:tetratricopeptide repeat protein [Streptosporangium carneum]GLK09497.1 hypothetical protein GCM10017600_29030 [Streptosporangium carneum]
MTGTPHNEISGGVFFSTVIQGRDVTVRLPPRVPLALSGLPSASAAFTGRADDLRAVLDTLAPRPPADAAAHPGGAAAHPGGSALRMGETAVPGMAAQAGGSPLRAEGAAQAGGATHRTGGVAVPDGAIPQPGGTARTDEPPRTVGSGSASTVVVTAVGGMGGVGKTELALQAAHTALRMGWFPGGALFADLFGYDSARRLDPDQVLDGWLRAMGVPGEHIPPTLQDRTRLYASVLAAYAREGRRMLVVVDNVSSHEQVRPLLPADGVTAAIVTSRHTLGMLGARLLDLDVLDPAEAVTLLERTLRVASPGDRRITDNPEAAAALAELCGGLPLALRIIAALLAVDPTCPPAAIVARLSSADSRLDEMEYDAGVVVGGTPPSPHQFAVSAALDLSHRHLNLEQARLFRLLPLNPGPEISTEATAVLAGIGDVPARRLLEGLAQAHLIERGSSYGRWRMHDLVRLFADRHGRADADADDRASALATLLQYYVSGAVAASGRLEHAFDDPMTDAFADRDHALAWLDVEYPNLAATVAVAGDDRHVVAWLLPVALAGFLKWRRRFNDWVALTRHALRAADLLGSEHAKGMALNNLGNALRFLRRFDEAITACREAGHLLRASGDLKGEAAALSNLGDALCQTRRFDEAVVAHRQSIRICREVGDRHGEAAALNSLGDDLQELRRLDEAVAVHRQAVDLYRETGDRHQEGVALNSLGNALMRSRHLEEAVVVYRQAARIFTETGDRHSEGMALSNLGSVLREVGSLTEAIAAHRQAMGVFEETGDRHSEAATLNNLGDSLRQAGALAEAVDAHRRAADLYRETNDSHGEAKALSNLGTTLATAGQLDQAATAHRRAADLHREAGDPHGEAGALTNLGNALLQVMRSEDAVVACRRAADVYRETGDRHGEAKALGNLGIALGQTGRFDEAITAGRHAAAIFHETGDRQGESIVTNILRRLEEAQRTANTP